jgi:hypothetical protein
MKYLGSSSGFILLNSKINRDIKVKVKLSVCLSSEALCHEDVWASECIDPRILDLGSSWRRVVSFTLQTLYPGERTPDTDM